jgi:glycosyltransferase involved in cell wall biosynthesis
MAQRFVARFPASVLDYITLSDRSAGLLRPYLPADARFHPLANIIDVDPCVPADVGANRTLMVVGRLDPEKGVALAAMAARQAHVPIQFVGDGPQRAIVEATGATVTGWLTADGVRQAVRQARCLVFPSLWYETFGLVVDEAAAQGVPSIVSDVSAPAERVVDGQTGWVFPSGDREALARIMTLTRDSAVVRAAGAAAFDRYWRRPSDPRRHATDLAAIYEAVIAHQGHD